MKNKKGVFVGIDIGGTKTRGILWDGKKILRKRKIKTSQTRAGFENGLKKIIAGLSRGKKIAGIGIGSASVVSGTILKFSANIPKVKNFDFNNLRDFIPQVVGFHPAKIKVDNDARCFARGEYLLGAGSPRQRRGSGYKSIFALTIGTGIGRAYVKNGKILKVKKLEYAERWEKKYQKIRDKKGDSELAEFLGKNLTKLIKPYKPQAIIIGGGVAMKRRNFISKLKKSFIKNGLKVPVLKSRLGDHSAALGAVLLFE